MKNNFIADTPQCFNNHMGLWAIEPQLFSFLYSQYQAGNLPPVTMAEMELKKSKAKEFEMYENVAVIRINGVMMKSIPKSINGTSTIYCRNLIKKASMDKDVKAIILKVDSGGGHVAGTMELASEVLKAKAQKPVYSYIEDCGASASYWVASQADKVYSNQMANVGSIGTLVVLEDHSARAEKEGIKVHVVSTGDFKGAGVTGTEITKELLGYVQEIVDKTNIHFLSAVQTARGFSDEQINSIANGKVWLAEEAQKLGLIDSIMTFEDLLGSLINSERKGKSTQTARKRFAML